MSREVVFLKLGGSLITDKRGVESVRRENLENVSEQISDALKENPGLKGKNNFLAFIGLCHKIVQQKMLKAPQ